MVYNDKKISYDKHYKIQLKKPQPKISAYNQESISDDINVENNNEENDNDDDINDIIQYNSVKRYLKNRIRLDTKNNKILKQILIKQMKVTNPFTTKHFIFVKR